MILVDEKKVENKYSAIHVVAQRARDLCDGMPPMTAEPEEKAVSQAIDEYMRGLIGISYSEEEEDGAEQTENAIDHTEIAAQP